MIDVLGWCFGCKRELRWNAEQNGKWRPPTEHWRFGGGAEICRGPVWPGVRAHDQAEADRLIPELLAVESPGHWLEWVPGRGKINLSGYLTPDFVAHYRETDASPSTTAPPNEETGIAVAQIARAAYKERGHGLIDWLRISADPDGPPVNIDHVRAVVAEAREAGVPVWIERLGPHPRGEIGIGRDIVVPAAAVIKDPAGSDPAEWPRDLRRCRELPEVE
ncbi:MAG TPA: hypothetical protein VLV83_14960 [Acidobacteriota bacterium]|nr:hypothetical protein [Acidobacteriota bacterium]